MATELEDLIQAWGEAAGVDHDPLGEIEALGGPPEDVTREAIAWANDVDERILLFVLAVCVSEVIGRFGVEATESTLTGMLDDPSIRAIGAVVHTQRLMEEGAIDLPEGLREALAALMEDEDRDDATVVIDFNTGEIV